MSWPLVYLGVAFTTLATILLELSLTRIFSVVFYYHFAFLAISIALFGLGAGGLLSYAVARRRPVLFHKLGVLSAAAAVAALGALGYILAQRGDLSGGVLALVYLAGALPFLLAGTVISSAIAETVDRVDRVYFFDLIGAAAGCLLFVPLLDVTGGPNTVIGAAVMFAAAAAIWFTLGASWRGRTLAVAVALSLVGLVVLNTKRPLVDVRYAKGERLARELFVKWNAFSRVALVEDSAGAPRIQVDADATIPIAVHPPGGFSAEQRRKLLATGPGLAYLLRPAARALILGAGGGEPVLLALASGSREIIALETNPIIAGLLTQERFAALSGRLFHRPEVRLVIGDGRSFLRRTARQYDVVQLCAPGARRAVSGGAHALTETALLTREAFADLLSRLAPGGLLSITQWSLEPPVGSLRIVATAADALRQRGESEVRRHVVVVRDASNGQPRDTVLVARAAFRSEDLEQVAGLVRGGALEALYVPGDDGAPFSRLLEPAAFERFLEEYPYDISPVDDNRPFFYYTERPGALLASMGDGAAGAGSALWLLVRLIGIGVLATAILLLLPPLFLGGFPRRSGAIRWLWYFVFIGAGFLLVQISLIHKFVLFLGNPTYALTVIIFSMLVSSGTGSFYSRRVAGSSEQGLMGALATAALLVALMAVLIPPLTRTGAGWPLPAKVLVSVSLIAPAGFVMGMAFPSGLSRLSRIDPPAVRWAWALNVSASVLGSVTAVFLALHLGLRETLLVGGVMYLAALMTIGPKAAPTNR